MIHNTAICETKDIGENTNIWAYSHLLPNCRVGSQCNICDGVFIENDVTVGDRVTIKCGVQLWDGIFIENDVFIGPNATFANDLFPRSKAHDKPTLKTLVCAGASIGANATILPGITIGRMAMVGAGAVVTKSVPPFAIVVGNPARIVGYAGTNKLKARSTSSEVPSAPGKTTLAVRGVTVHRLKSVKDLRGELTVGNCPQEIPFAPQRFFLVHNVPSTEVRGEHAHFTCEQFLIAAHGSVTVMADDGYQRNEVILDSPHIGIYLPPLTWGVQYKYSSDAVLLVFASHPYDNTDYIRDYDAFVAVVDKNNFPQ